MNACGKRVVPVSVRDGDSSRWWQWSAISALAMPCMFAFGAAVHAADGQYIANNTPGYVATSKSLGAADESQRIEVSLWLKPHDRPAMDALAQQLYDRNSPNYRHWLKPQQIAQRFAPTAAEAQVVEAFLESRQLTVSSIGPNNFYVRASGSIAQVEQAFAVQIKNYAVDGRTARANSSNPYIEGPAAALVQSVAGLDAFPFQSPGMFPPGIGFAQGQAGANRPRAPSSPQSDVAGFTSRCFPGTVTQKVTTLGSYPKATFTGNEYVDSGGGCAYAPADIRAAYNLDALYAEGYDGAGQTIVLVEDCGSPTLLDDANTFNERFGLPLLTPSNFSVTNLGSAASDCPGYYPGIQADVEWVHTIAPGAALAVVYAASDDPEDTDEAVFYAVNYGLGSVVSDANAYPERRLPQAYAQEANLISEMAAMEGIDANYPAAAGGEDSFEEAPAAPADGSYATGIGGISLGLDATGSIAFETAWEDHLSILLNQGAIAEPPYVINEGQGYIGGTVGGASEYFAKPAFQNGAVAGKQRGVPDFSWVADPNTGLITVATTFTQEPPQSWFAYGGNPVATAMFSGLWAIANQKAGMSLGQAAPYLYSLPAAAYTDIMPYSSKNDVVDTVQESSSSTIHYNAAQTMAVLPAGIAGFGPFYSALWQNPQGAEDTTAVLSFGANNGGNAAVGWDVDTGVGAPKDAKAFVDWVGCNNQ
jgi:subtilase family serine protease